MKKKYNDGYTLPIIMYVTALAILMPSIMEWIKYSVKYQFVGYVQYMTVYRFGETIYFVWRFTVLVSIILVITASVLVYWKKNRGQMNRRLEDKLKNANYSKADEITKLKGLLDAGTISQEEFDNEKKRILND